MVRGERNVIEFRSKEDLELEFFKELPDLELLGWREERGDLSLFFDLWKVKSLLALKKVNEKLICSDGHNYFLIKEHPQFEEGDKLICEEYGYGYTYDTDVLVKIDDDVNFDEFGKKFSELEGVEHKIDLGKLKGKILNKKVMEQIYDEKSKEAKEKKENYEEDEKRKKEDEEEAKRLWVEKSYYARGDFVVEKNIITNGNHTFTLNRNVNQVYEYNTINYSGFVTELRDRLIDVGESFEFATETEFTKKEGCYKVEFTNKGTFLNGIKVRKDKVIFILNRSVYSGLKKETIEMFNKLSGMKVEFLNLNSINVSSRMSSDKNLKIPIKVDLKDELHFKVSVLGRKAIMGWNDVKEIFFPKSRRIFNSMGISTLTKLGDVMKIPKQEVYDYLKKVVMAGKLGDENE